MRYSRALRIPSMVLGITRARSASNSPSGCSAATERNPAKKRMASGSRRINPILMCSVTSFQLVSGFISSPKSRARTQTGCLHAEYSSSEPVMAYRNCRASTTPSRNSVPHGIQTSTSPQPLDEPFHTITPHPCSIATLERVKPFLYAPHLVNEFVEPLHLQVKGLCEVQRPAADVRCNSKSQFTRGCVSERRQHQRRSVRRHDQHTLSCRAIGKPQEGEEASPSEWSHPMAERIARSVLVRDRDSMPTTWCARSKRRQRQNDDPHGRHPS